MKLYEFGPTRSIRARWILQELGVDFEAVRVDLTRREHCSPDFLELNPAGRVPVLIDADLVLVDERMYARPRAPQRIADIFRAMRPGEVNAKATA